MMASCIADIHAHTMTITINCQEMSYACLNIIEYTVHHAMFKV